MQDNQKTRSQLIDELQEARARISELEMEARKSGGAEDPRSPDELTLQESEQRFRFLAENMADIVWTLDLDFRTTYVSPSIEKVLGFTPEERKKQTLEEMVTLDSLQRILETLAEELSRDVEQGVDLERFLTIEVEYYHADGHTIWMENRVKALRNRDGVLVGIYGTTYDITERRRAEQSLRESEERFRLLFDSTSDLITLCDERAIPLWANRAWKRLFGPTPITSTWELVHPADVDRIAATWNTLVTEDIDVVMDFRFRLPNGSYGHFEASAHSVQPFETKRYFVVAHNVTDRKLAEEQLRQLTQFQDSVIDSANVWLDVQDRNANVLIWNKAAEKMSGYTREEVIGHGLIWQWLYPDEAYRSEITTMFSRIIRSGDAIEDFETTIRVKTGEKRIISWHSRNLANEDGVPSRSITIGRDITEHRALEEQLRMSQKMEAIGRLAGGVAHDFNNVLCVIKGNVELMLDDLPPDNPQRELMQEVAGAARQAVDLTQRLLTFSHKQMIKLKVINLNQLIENLHSMLVRLIGEDIILQMRLQEELGWIRADPGQIEQVVLNLVLNARDAMPYGGELYVETTTLAEDDHGGKAELGQSAPCVMFKVRDTGCGMSAETRAKIFEPFFTTKRMGQGTGLGLSTVFGIVEQSKGWITVHSELGQGSTFEVIFPSVPEEEGVVAHQETPVTTGGQETVLVVEDDEMVRSLATKLLGRLGYKVLVAGSGEEALVLSQRYEEFIDLLLTDVVMPNMNGRELADELTRMRPGIKVLFTSGYSQDVIAQRGVLEEGIQFVAKPYSYDSLASHVREVLNGD